MCDIYPPLRGVGGGNARCHHWMSLLPFAGFLGTPRDRAGGSGEPQEGAGWGSCAREPPGDGRKRSQFILARKGSGAGAPGLQGTKRDAPATKSGGTGCHAAPEGVWWKAQGGSNPPTESRGQGLTLRQTPLVTAGSSARGRARGKQPPLPMGTGLDEPGRAPGSPTPARGLKAGVGVSKQPPAPCHPPPPRA